MNELRSYRRSALPLLASVAALLLAGGFTASCAAEGADTSAQQDITASHPHDGGAGDAGRCGDPLQEGTACDLADGGSGFCNNGACGPWDVAHHAAPAPIPRLSDGGTVSNAKMYVITFDGDALRGDIEAYASWLGTSAWISVLGQYGFKSVDYVKTVHLPTPPPVADPKFPGVAYGAATMSAFTQSLIDNGTLPPADESTIYAVWLPYQPDSFYAASTSGLCKDLFGYHSHDTLADGGASPLHVLVGTECDHQIHIFGSEEEVMQGTFSHEFAEWVTDADDVGFRFPPTSLAGTAGPENADMCSFTEFGYVDPVFGYHAVPIWSNAAIAKGDAPCQPWNSHTPFVNVDTPSDYQLVSPGQTTTIDLTGYATAPTTAWRISTIDQWGPGDFAVNPQLSAQTITNGGKVTMTVTIPPSATSGQQDVVWIESSTLDAHFVAGWMVGLKVK